MFEIINRVLSGAIFILWVFSWWMYLLKNKFERMCAELSIILICIGLIDCMLTAIGLI